MLGKDWASTPLGPPEQWPQSLRTAVSIILTSRYPMFVWWGKDGINLYNDPYIPMLGSKHPQSLGMPAREVWKEIWDQIGPRTEAVLSRGESTFDEALLLMMDRHGYIEETYFTFSYSPLPDDRAKIGGLFCAVTEETERVIGERRLSFLRKLAVQTSEARTVPTVCECVANCLREANKDLPFALIYLRDAEGNLRRAANTGIASSHAAAPALIAPGEGKLWPAQEALCSGHALVIDHLNVRFPGLPTGAWAAPPHTAVAFPLAQQGQSVPVGVLIVGANPHRQVDDGFTGFVGLIAGQIAAAIANANAYEAERRRAEALAELDRAKSTFFSNVSHEFRTPLTLMLGPLEELLDPRHTLSSQAQRHELAVVHRNGLRLLKLVNSLLDFSRIEAGKIDAHYEPVDLGAYTTELASLFRSAMKKAGLEFNVRCDAHSEPVYLDREMWEKVVLNLLSNAMKFTLRGQVDVTLRSVEGHAELKVRDTGSGIPEHELPHVFRRFHRVEGAQGRTHEGTGIGLALVDELVRLHGGTVQVESKLGVGTTFTVKLPYGADHLPAEKIARARALRSLSPQASPYVQEALRWLPEPTNGGAIDQERESANEDLTNLFPDREVAEPAPSGRILLADDNRDMREYLQRLLARRYTVIAAQDGREALELARANPPDLILTDMMMPRMDGYELLRELRNDPRTMLLPVIMLSARAGEESRVEGLEAGADDYLVKPFTARELMARVSAHLSMKQLREESRHREQRERRRAEAAEAQYQRILESISEGFLFVDTDWTIRYINQVYARMTHRIPQELVGANLWKVFPEAAATRFGEQYREAMLSQKEVEMEDYYEPLDAWLRIHLYPTTDGLAMFVADVTAERRQKHALLVSEKLAAAGRLASTVAHEINNPLESVVNLLYLARNATTPEQREQYLDYAEREISRVSHIARQTLGFYRETAHLTCIPVRSVVETLLRVYQGKIKSKNIVVTTNIDAGLEITARSGELNQVLSNLITNAIDACGPEGGLTISAKASAGPHSNSGVEITVSDTGAGIEQENLGRVFEPFFTTKKDVGTGLGLWVVKQIVEGSQGSVSIRSSTEAGRQGTTVTLYLPQLEEVLAQAAGPSTSAA